MWTAFTNKNVCLDCLLVFLFVFRCIFPQKSETEVPYIWQLLCFITKKRDERDQVITTRIVLQTKWHFQALLSPSVFRVSHLIVTLFHVSKSSYKNPGGYTFFCIYYALKHNFDEILNAHCLRMRIKPLSAKILKILATHLERLIPKFYAKFYLIRKLVILQSFRVKLTAGIK